MMLFSSVLQAHSLQIPVAFQAFRILPLLLSPLKETLMAENFISLTSSNDKQNGKSF